MGIRTKLTVLYDGKCPICCHKVQFLRRRDQKSHLDFIDITQTGFNPAVYELAMPDLLREIHAVLPNGSVVSRMDVIRATYGEIGLGWLAAPTGWPLLRPLFDLLYRTVARHRYSISRLFPKATQSNGAKRNGNR